MKKALQVTFGAILAVSIVSSVHAAAYDDIGGRTALLVTGNYTKLSNNGLEYGPLNLSDPTAPTIFKDSIMNPDWSWDLGLGLTHRFCNSDTRIFAYWDHYRNDDSQTATPTYHYSIGNATSVSNVNYGSDEVRLGVSQAFEFGTLASLSLGGYFEWVKLTRDMNVFDSTGNYFNTYNKMDGYGPGIAAMARVYPFTNFGFLSALHGIGGFLGTTTSLLYAHNDFSHAYATTGTNFLRTSSSESIVGKLDISFGLDYCSELTNGTMFGLSLGMRYLNIFNAFKNANQGPILVPTSPVDLSGNIGSDDWGRMGPFIQFRIGGADA